MIEHRHLIKEIPSGRFHSVLMTSYSINMYYWEVQLLKTLSQKGINLVSAIVDSDCLSDQLFKFSRAFRGNRPLEFSLHGFKSKGAFHPKIQFYVGNDCLLVLIGSGNITVSGHGGNMEVWSPVMVDDKNNPAYPFVRDVWNYLKSLYDKLGNEARNIIDAVVDNCKLLQEEYTSTNVEHVIGDDSTIRLFANGNKTLFTQCEEWIGNDDIKYITVMSPFYDSHASFVQALYEKFHPKEIRVIVEDGFGAAPKAKYVPEYIKMYKWESVFGELRRKDYQKYFHAKCFFFTGSDYNYLLCGSANASVAAFGLPGVESCNYEASVGYKSKVVDYFAESGFVLEETVAPDSIVSGEPMDRPKLESNVYIWIREVSYYYDEYIVNLVSEKENDVKLRFFSGNREVLYEKDVHVRSGECEVEGDLTKDCNPLYVEMVDMEGNLISNRQFAISTQSLIVNDPSPEISNYRIRTRDIEAGKFVNGKVLQFMENILKGSEGKLNVRGTTNANDDDKKDDKTVHIFNSQEEYFKDDGTGITGDIRKEKRDSGTHHSTLLFDSIISYVTKSNKIKEEEEMDDEETENFKKSNGKESTSASRKRERIKNPSSVRDKILKMLEEYKSIISPSNKKYKVNFIDSLRRFMTALFVMNRTIGFRYESEDGILCPIISIGYSKFSSKTITEYVYRIISSFCIYIIRGDVLAESNKVFVKKLNSYKQYTFELCLAIVSVCDWINEGDEVYENILTKYKQSLFMNLGKVLDIDLALISANSVFKHIDSDIQELDGFDKAHLEKIISNNLSLLLDKNAEYPIGTSMWTDDCGYMTLLFTHPKYALLCSTAFEYVKKWDAYSEGKVLLYDTKKVLSLNINKIKD